MAANYRASATAGGGQSATVSTLSVTVPTTGPGGTVAAGDFTLIFVQAASTTATLTTPTGWKLEDGPVRGSYTTTWGFSRTLVAGDVGASVPLAFSTAVRCQAVLLVASGVDTSNWSGLYQTENAATSSLTIPTLSGVAAGSLVLSVLMRRLGLSSATTLHMPSSLAEIAPVASTYSNAPQLTSLGGWMVTASTGSVSGTASSSPATTGFNYLIALPPSTSGASASAPMATAAGTGAAVPLTVTGAGAGTGPTTLYQQAIRAGGVRFTHSLSATLGGVPISGAQDLRPTGGTISDTTKPGVRRLLSLELAPEPGLYDLLSTPGVTLTASCTVTYQDQSTQTIPMGVFDVDALSVTEGGGKISLTAPDKWVRIQRARFLTPQASAYGFPVTQQIAFLIQGALGSSETVSITSTSTATMGTLVWDRDRDKAILDLAQSIGAWVYFDRQGQATVADIPTLSTSADWVVDASAAGVLVSLDRQTSRTTTRNVVVVSSSRSGGPSFAPQVVWDNNPDSPTYAGTDPINHPGAAGPFGVVPEFYASAVLSSAAEAYQAGVSILSRTVGLASQVSLSTFLNPQMDAFQKIDVLPPRVEYAPDRVMERHVVDTVTHPLTVSSSNPQHIDGRSTRTDPYVSDFSS